MIWKIKQSMYYTCFTYAYLNPLCSIFVLALIIFIILGGKIELIEDMIQNETKNK